MRLYNDHERRVAHRTLKEVKRKLEEALRLSRMIERRRLERSPKDE
ncbi:MAG: hypothetical protein M3Y18_00680 [Candidatus Eremiobacteraeota bacterium]|nr:hypothetical protein [Candidatus Eremiobacteraeota bacterium]